jgi:hypothetical protein
VLRNRVINLTFNLDGTVHLTPLERKVNVYGPADDLCSLDKLGEVSLRDDGTVKISTAMQDKLNIFDDESGDTLIIDLSEDPKRRDLCEVILKKVATGENTMTFTYFDLAASQYTPFMSADELDPDEDRNDVEWFKKVIRLRTRCRTVEVDTPKYGRLKVHISDEDDGCKNCSENRKVMRYDIITRVKGEKQK